MQIKDYNMNKELKLTRMTQMMQEETLISIKIDISLRKIKKQ